MITVAVRYVACALVLALGGCGQARPVRLEASGSMPPRECTGGSPDLTTPYEHSGKTKTPRYKETITYCEALAHASDQVAFSSFGTSPQGRALPLLIVDKEGLTSPKEIRAAGRAVVLIEGCLHAGESAGKDAGLTLVRDLTVGNRHRALLDDVSVLFIPIFNVDGHERFGPYNRINQNGPRQMGWRTTARNLNLNRDFLKADTAEMRAWLTLYSRWLPELFIDVHSTDGADYQYQLTYSVETHGNLDKELSVYVETLANDLTAAMGAKGYKIFPYVWFKKWHDPKSGLLSGVAGPRYSNGYAAVQNRLGLLIEAHMLKPYSVRVDGTYDMLAQAIAHVGKHKRELQQAIQKADQRTASRKLRERGIPLHFETTDKSRTVPFEGVEYEVVKSDVTGGDWFRYSDQPTTFEIPYFDDVVPTLTVKLPEAYVIPSEWSEITERLELHGVKVTRLDEPIELTVRSYRFENIEFKAESPWNPLPYEGHHMAEFDVEPVNEVRTLPAGSAIIDTAQRTARLIAHALEPEGPDSFVHWGFFNAIFQEAEYAESYVIEELARKMLEGDPALAVRFEEKKRASPEFAADPTAIRHWFYEQTPYYDTRMNVYPISLIDDRTVVERLLRNKPR